MSVHLNHRLMGGGNIYFDILFVFFHNCDVVAARPLTSLKYEETLFYQYFVNHKKCLVLY